MRAHTKFKKNGTVENLYFTNPVEIITAGTPFDEALDRAEQYQKDTTLSSALLMKKMITSSAYTIKQCRTPNF